MDLRRDGLEEERDSRQRGASRVRDIHFALAISCISEAGPDAFFRQIGEFPQNVGVGHSGGKVIQHIIHGNAEAENAGFAAVLGGFNRDDVRVIYDSTLSE
jgi:hypothetical protein